MAAAAPWPADVSIDLHFAIRYDTILVDPLYGYKYNAQFLARGSLTPSTTSSVRAQEIDHQVTAA